MNAPAALMQSARTEIPGFAGSFTGPDDTGYEQTRAVYNAMIDRHPSLIATPADAEDAAKVVSFAASHDLLLAVRGGGHNGAGLGTCDDGLVIDLSALRSVEVDPDDRRQRLANTVDELVVRAHPKEIARRSANDARTRLPSRATQRSSASSIAADTSASRSPPFRMKSTSSGLLMRSVRSAMCMPMA